MRSRSTRTSSGDWLRVFRNGAMAIGCLPVSRLIENPQVRSVLAELVKAEGIPFRSWYEEFAPRDDHEPNSPELKPLVGGIGQRG